MPELETLYMREDSTEYVYATITADHDLTDKVIEVALPRTAVEPSTWYQAEVTVLSSGPSGWTATFRILVGPAPGVVTLAPGVYDWTVRVTDSPEKPVRKTGLVLVTHT